MNATLPRLVLATLLLGTAAAADTGGRISLPPSQERMVPNLPTEPAQRPFQYDDRAAPHGTDASRNWPVPHPGRALNVQLIQPAYAFKGLTEPERRLLQGKLASWGYYSGPVDGAWNAALWAAVEAYAADLDLADHLDDKAGSLAVFRHIAN